MAFEYHGIVYDTTNEKLAKLLEAIRQRQKQDNPFRITIRWISGEFKPYSGYIVMTNPKRLTEWDKEVSFPLLAWNKRSSRGKHLDPSLIDSIHIASEATRKKLMLNKYLYLREENYFDGFCMSLVDAAFY